VNLLLYLIGFPFSFFFILLSYWKEDRILNIIGSLSAFTLVLILIGTGIQIVELKQISQISYNYTNNVTINFAYSPQVFSYEVSYLENLGIGLMIAVIIAIQYLYFTFVYSEVSKYE